MQEEIEQKSFNIMISTTKLSARTVLRAVKAAFRLYQSKTSQGKQSVRTLLRQNRGVSSVEISKTGIRGLERYAKKYGIDYAIRKDASEVPPRYLVFFKAPDAEAFHSAFPSIRLSRNIRHPCSTRTNAPLCWQNCMSWCRQRQNSPAKSGTRNRSVDCDHEKADKTAGAVSALYFAGTGGNKPR
ncbi:MAG: PcfB family protein [Faecalibacterium prausnitzii]